jgi:hypothetical protein
MKILYCSSKALIFINLLIFFSCKSNIEKKIGTIVLNEYEKISIQSDYTWEYPTYKFNYIFKNKIISKNTEFFYDGIDFKISDFKIFKCETMIIVYVQYESELTPLIILNKNIPIYVHYSYPINESKYISKEKANLYFKNCKALIK